MTDINKRMMNNTKIPDYVKSIDKLPKEHPFYGREKDFIKLMNDDLPKELPQTNDVDWKTLLLRRLNRECAWGDMEPPKYATWASKREA